MKSTLLARVAGAAWPLLFAVSALAQPGGTTIAASAPNQVAGLASEVGNDNAGARSAVSADGRYVAFSSAASNLVANDTNGVFDVFVRDTWTNRTERVSVSDGGVQGNSASANPDISADGRIVVFESSASNLVSNDTNGTIDVFAVDRLTHTIRRVSVSSTGVQGNSLSFESRISANGRYVAFASDANNLDGADANGFTPDVYRYDLATGQTLRVSLSSTGAQANASSVQPVLSADGHIVVFATDASNLGCVSPLPAGCLAGTTDGNGVRDIYLHDIDAGTTTRVSRGNDAAESNNLSEHPSVSADGRYVVFDTLASNLLCGLSRPSLCAITGRLDSNAARDIYLRDVQAGATSRISFSVNGGDPTQDSSFPQISSDGTRAVFQSLAANLLCEQGTICPAADADSNGVADVFARSREAGPTTRLSVEIDGTPRTGGGQFPVVSADGRRVAFMAPPDVPANGGTTKVQILVRVPTPRITKVVPSAGGATGGTRVTLQGADFLPGAQLALYAPAITVNGAFTLLDTAPSALSIVTLPNSIAAYDAEVLNPDGGRTSLAQAFRVIAPAASATADTDHDGMTDLCELTYSFDPLDPSDAPLDADGDGRSNLVECQAGSHPTARGVFTRYFAEGSTGPFFITDLAFLEPTGTVPANLVLHFLLPDGTSRSTSLTVPAGRRRSLDVATVPGMANTAFATLIESDALFVADRTMSWDATRYGAHAETATYPSPTWYLAEGATHSGFDLFYLLQNPNDAAVTATVKYLRPVPARPIEKTYTLGPLSRTNIWVNLEGPELAATDVSAVVTATAPIIVERAMYLSRPGQYFAAGHESAGVNAPATDWFLAEGATGPFFDLFVLIANPGDIDAQVEATYLLEDGTTVTKPYTIAANSRFNIWVDYEDPRLANAAVSTTIRSLNMVPVLVERAMWWPDGGWYEAHNSPGATTAGTLWALAEGEQGGPRNIQTYVLLANPGATAVNASVALFFDDQTPAVTKNYVLGPHSRTNVPVGQDFPGAVGKRFGVRVDSDDAIVVERAIYWDANGVFWAAGTNALATRLR